MAQDKIFLQIGGASVYWHGLIIMLGILAGVLLTCLLRSEQYKYGIRSKGFSNMLITLLACMPAAFFGSWLYFSVYGSTMFEDGNVSLNTSNGGYSVIGALLGVFLATVAAGLLTKSKIGELLDCIAPGLALSIAIGRWAAAFSGENIGDTVENVSFQRFPFSIYNADYDEWSASLFLWQSLIAMFICIVTLWLFQKKYIKRSLDSDDGDIFIIFVILFTLPQGIFEHYRYDALYYKSIFLHKLQTFHASLIYCTVVSALALSVLILRHMFREGIKWKTCWRVLACAVFYLCYFNQVLRLDLPSEGLALAVMVVGAAGLIFVGLSNFYVLLGTQGRKGLLDKGSVNSSGDRQSRGYAQAGFESNNSGYGEPESKRPTPDRQAKDISKRPASKSGDANDFWGDIDDGYPTDRSKGGKKNMKSYWD